MMGTARSRRLLNWMHGCGPITSGVARFAAGDRHRSLDVMANVAAANAAIPNPKCARFIRLISGGYSDDQRVTQWKDFRLELLDLAELVPLAFAIAASERNPFETASRRRHISGQVTLGTPVISTVGDRQLRLTHGS